MEEPTPAPTEEPLVDPEPAHVSPPSVTATQNVVLALIQAAESPEQIVGLSLLVNTAHDKGLIRMSPNAYRMLSKEASAYANTLLRKRRETLLVQPPQGLIGPDGQPLTK